MHRIKLLSRLNGLLLEREPIHHCSQVVHTTTCQGSGIVGLFSVAEFTELSREVTTIAGVHTTKECKSLAPGDTVSDTRGLDSGKRKNVAVKAMVTPSTRHDLAEFIDETTCKCKFTLP